MYIAHMSSVAKKISQLPAQLDKYPRMRYMGNKYKLLPWLRSAFEALDFETVLDPFCGSGSVSYLLKSLDKQVVSTDFLNFPVMLSKALVENDGLFLSEKNLRKILNKRKAKRNFALETYQDIFFSADDLHFIDLFWSVIPSFENDIEKAIAIAALVRSCAKRQPRGIFTVAGDPEKYKDGRRDLSLSLREHFQEQVHVIHQAVFTTNMVCRSVKQDVFAHQSVKYDLVYLDPPYIPKANDNCYMKRYHFLEGISCYWEGQELLESSKVKKIKKPYTPFSYKSTALQTFDKLFHQFQKSTMVLSYSSNSFPDIDILVQIMKRYKRSVQVLEKEHRYHIGNHQNALINDAKEYLVIGKS